MYEPPTSDLKLNKDKKGKLTSFRILLIFSALLSLGFWGGCKYSQKLGKDELQKERMHNFNAHAFEERFNADILYLLVKDVQNSNFNDFYSRACGLMSMSLNYYDSDLNSGNYSEVRKKALLDSFNKINDFVKAGKQNDSCNIGQGLN